MTTTLEDELRRLAGLEEVAQTRMLAIEQETRAIMGTCVSVNDVEEPGDQARLSALALEIQQCRTSVIQARAQGWALIRAQEQLEHVGIERGVTILPRPRGLVA